MLGTSTQTAAPVEMGLEELESAVEPSIPQLRYAGFLALTH